MTIIKYIWHLIFYQMEKITFDTLNFNLSESINILITTY